MVVFVCPCVGIGPRKKLVKRLAVMVKGCTFALVSAVKHVFYSVFFVHMVVFVCPCVGIGPRKKLVKRLAVMVKGCTFALAFGKQGLVWPLRSGGGK